MSKPHVSGIRLMIQASAAFSMMALCVKFVSRSLPSLEIVFFRSVIGTLMILSVMLPKRIPLLGNERAMMILRGTSGFLALSLHFFTIAHLPLGTAVLLNYTAPIFAALFAIAFLKERPSFFLLLMALVSFLGVYLLMGGTPDALNPYALIALLSAVFAAVAYVSIRTIRYRESPFTVILYFTGISTLGSIFFLPFGFKWPGPIDWLFLIGIGIGSFYGQLWLTLSLRKTPASLVSPFCYTTPLLSFVYGVIFFHDPLTAKSLVGGFLIIFGGTLISYIETREKSGRGGEIGL